MTDTTNELAPPTVECSLQTDIDRLKASMQDLRRQYNGIRESLESGLHEVDEDYAEQVMDFLNANTPWEFSLEREYRVRITGWVTVSARSEQDATEAVENADWSWQADSRVGYGNPIEPESFEVHSVEVA